jgi:hypothetical protein
MKNREFIVLLGDVHNYSKIIRYAGAIKLSDCDLIQAGDFGVGFGNDENRLNTLNQFLVEHNIFLHVIRGNHDDPAYFKGEHRDVYSNIDFIPDYTIKQIQNKNILFIGGATSVDRKANPKVPDLTSKTGYYMGRIAGIDYWEDEALVFNEEFIRGVSGVDTIITHTAPTFVFPQSSLGAKVWMEFDPTLEEELHRERSILSDVYFILKQNNEIRDWYYGHFHNVNVEEYEKTKFRLLDILEFYEIR